METTNIVDFARRDGMSDALTELLKTGAQELIATAVEAELVSYLAQFTGLRTDAGVSETLCMRLSPCDFDGSFIEPFWI